MNTVRSPFLNSRLRGLMTASLASVSWKLAAVADSAAIGSLKRTDTDRSPSPPSPPSAGVKLTMVGGKVS